MYSIFFFINISSEATFRNMMIKIQENCLLSFPSTLSIVFAGDLSKRKVKLTF